MLTLILLLVAGALALFLGAVVIGCALELLPYAIAIFVLWQVFHLVGCL